MTGDVGIIVEGGYCSVHKEYHCECYRPNNAMTAEEQVVTGIRYELMDKRKIWELTKEKEELKASLESLCERTRNLTQPAYFCFGLEKSTEENIERNTGALNCLKELLVHVRASEELLYGEKS